MMIGSVSTSPYFAVDQTDFYTLPMLDALARDQRVRSVDRFQVGDGKEECGALAWKYEKWRGEEWSGTNRRIINHFVTIAIWHNTKINVTINAIFLRTYGERNEPNLLIAEHQPRAIHSRWADDSWEAVSIIPWAEWHAFATKIGSKKCELCFRLNVKSVPPLCSNHGGPVKVRGSLTSLQMLVPMSVADISQSFSVYAGSPVFVVVICIFLTVFYTSCTHDVSLVW